MGDLTRFDLKKNVARWRQSLSAARRLASRQPDELESQLRATTDRLSSAGLTEDEARLIAVKRLGEAAPARKQAAPSACAAKWRHRVFWMACGLLGAQVWSTLLNFLGLWLTPRGQLQWRPELDLAANLAIALPIGWLLITGRLEGPIGWLARHLEHSSRLRAAIIGGVALVSAQLWGALWWQERAQATGIRSFQLLSLLWTAALSVCVWRLAPVNAGGGRDAGLAGLNPVPATSGAPGPFDLESSVLNWRREVLAGESLSTSDTRELEAHLRDTFAGETTRGHAPAEAFQIAVERLGNPAALAVEFEKENPGLKWRHRLFWIGAGLFGARLVFNAWELLWALGEQLARHNHTTLYSIPGWLLLHGLAGQLSMLAAGYLLLRGKLEPFVNRLAPRLQTRRAVSVLVLGLQVPSLGFLGLLYYWLLALQSSQPVVGPGYHLTAMSIALALASMLLLPAWLIFLAPLPRARLKS